MGQRSTASAGHIAEAGKGVDSSGQTTDPAVLTTTNHPSQQRAVAAATTAAAVAIPALQVRSESTDTPKDLASDTTPTTADAIPAPGVPREISHQRKVSDLTDDEADGLRHSELLAGGGLSAPDQRRLSNVSAVSSASPSPIDASRQEEEQRRVSPAEPPIGDSDRRPSDAAPMYEEAAPPALPPAAHANLRRNASLCLWTATGESGC
jgi:hypothetical protein